MGRTCGYYSLWNLNHAPGELALVDESSSRAAIWQRDVNKCTVRLDP